MNLSLFSPTLPPRRPRNLAMRVVDTLADRIRDGSLAWKVNANAEVTGVTAFVTGADTDRAGNVYFAWSLAAAGAADRGFVSKYS